MPVPRPLVAMERASGSVSEICWSGDSMFDPRLGHQARVTVSTVQLREVALHTLVELLHPCLQLAFGEVLVAVVDRLELTAVDGDRGLLEQAETTTQQPTAPRTPSARSELLAPEGLSFFHRQRKSSFPTEPVECSRLVDSL
jgi:hypothetical protein